MASLVTLADGTTIDVETHPHTFTINGCSYALSKFYGLPLLARLKKKGIIGFYQIELVQGASGELAPRILLVVSSMDRRCALA